MSAARRADGRTADELRPPTIELGLIDRDAALRVAQDAERDLAGTSPHASKWLDLQYDADRLRGT